MANTKNQATKEHKFVLRVPMRLYKKIQRATIKEKDSINRFIIMIVEAHLDNKDKKLDEILVITEKILKEVQETKIRNT